MDVTEIPMERLEAELVSFAAWEAAGLAKVLPVLAEFDRRQGWASWGCRSAQHWLSWKCGLGYTAATERLRVARALQQLPCTAAMFARATLSWSKVREITRVATPADEAKWAELAEWMTAAQLVRLTAAARKVTGRDLAANSNGVRCRSAAMTTVRSPSASACPPTPSSTTTRAAGPC